MQFPTISASDAQSYAAQHAETLTPYVTTFFRSRYGYAPDDTDVVHSVARFLADPFTYAGDPAGGGSFWPDLNRALAAISTPTPILTPSGDSKAASAQANALAVMRRRESMALSDRAAADARLAEQAATIARLEEALRSASGTSREMGVAWGPQHPDWMPFWRQAAADAEAAGNCSEYDRHAREMGGPERSALRYDGTGIDGGRVKRTRSTVDVEVIVTVSVDIEYDTDEGLNSSAITDALEGYSEGDYDYGRIYDWTVADSETVADGEGAYWTNPEANR